MTIPSHYRAALREFQDYIDDARRANYQTFGDALARVLNVIDSDDGLGRLASDTLPVSDFDSWFADLSGNVGGMGGQGALTWPRDTKERVAIQLELLRRVNDSRIDLYDFCRTFLESSSRYDDMVHAFAEHVLRSFARDFVRLMHSELETAGDAPQKSLKDLRNRDSLSVDLAVLLANRSAGLLFIDLDNFKAVNDTLGHQAGDQCLEQVATLVCAAIAGKGTAYKYGGDEFAVVLPNFSATESAATAERIRSTICDAKLGTSNFVTASIGVASEVAGGNPSELVARADKAMYQSKRRSKNAVSIWDGSVLQ